MRFWLSLQVRGLLWSSSALTPWTPIDFLGCMCCRCTGFQNAWVGSREPHFCCVSGVCACMCMCIHICRFTHCFKLCICVLLISRAVTWMLVDKELPPQPSCLLPLISSSWRGWGVVQMQITDGSSCGHVLKCSESWTIHSFVSDHAWLCLIEDQQVTLSLWCCSLWCCSVQMVPWIWLGEAGVFTLECFNHTLFSCLVH